MIGTCRLCLQEGVKLQKSHLLSASIYRVLRDEGFAPNPNPFLVSRQGSVQSSKQQWAHLLCRSCESILSREGENWVFRNGVRKDGRFPLGELLRRSPASVGTLADHTRLYECNLIPEINTAAITHFAVGMFWKASVYGWNDDGSIPVNLHEQADQFRRFLLGQADFPTDAVLTVSVREGGLTDRMTYAPAGVAQEQRSFYRFPIPGFSFTLTLGKDIPERISQYCFVRGLGRPIVVTLAVEEFHEREARAMLALQHRKD